MSADEDVPHRRLPPSPSGRKSHILAGSKSTGHSPVAEPNRPKPSSMRPKRSLARCVGVRVCGTLPQRPLQSRKKTAHKRAGAQNAGFLPLSPPAIP